MPHCMHLGYRAGRFGIRAGHNSGPHRDYLVGELISSVPAVER